MCLAVPFQVAEVRGTRAQVTLSGHSREIDITLVGPVTPGDWVLVHAGFAIETLSEQDARETLDLMGHLKEQSLAEE